MPSRVRSASWPDAILLGLLTALVLLAWYALWLWGRSPYGHMLLHAPMHLHMAARNPWLFAAIFVIGWTLMTMAMMLPTSFPLLLLFRRIVRGRATAAWLLLLLIGGYLASWLFCGVLLQVVNWAVHTGIAHLPWAAWSAGITGAIILSIAGLYQFSSLKYACLEKCRSPLTFITSRWQGGNESAQALRIGVEHGLFCVGCCWSLMLLMFLVGTSNLLWMLFLGVVMAVEKNFSWGRRVSAPLGVLLLAGAVAMLISGIRA
jgi:predicted metal-binding membrane protein